jgi:hypothetical protein
LAVPRQLTHVWARRTLSNRCCQLPWAWLLLANAPPRPPREDCLLNPFDLDTVDPPRIAPVVLPRVADPKAACGVDCATRVLEAPVKCDGLLPRPRPVAPVFGSMVVALANDWPSCVYVSKMNVEARRAKSPTATRRSKVNFTQAD